jgi:hypothetical protein
MSFVKENGGMLAVGLVLWGIATGVLGYMIKGEVSDQLDARGLISPDKITSIEQDIAEAKTQHQIDAERMDGKIERIVDILLEE